MHILYEIMHIVCPLIFVTICVRIKDGIYETPTFATHIHIYYGHLHWHKYYAKSYGNLF